jgi:hypothetical protein
VFHVERSVVVEGDRARVGPRLSLAAPRKLSVDASAQVAAAACRGEAVSLRDASVPTSGEPMLSATRREALRCRPRLLIRLDRRAAGWGWGPWVAADLASGGAAPDQTCTAVRRFHVERSSGRPASTQPSGDAAGPRA